jgi:hypothetical protein
MVIDPAPAMRLHIEAGADHCLQRLRVLPAGQADQVDRGLEPAVGKGFQQAPVTDAGAVLVTRFDIQIAAADSGLDPDVGQAYFGAIVAVQYAQLAAFLVIDTEIDRDTRIVGPHHRRWLIRVTDKITRRFEAVVHFALLVLPGSGASGSAFPVVSTPRLYEIASQISI